MLMIYLIPIILFIFCYIMGDFVQMIFKFKNGIAIKVIVGYLLIIGIFHLISIPFMIKETSFTPLYILYLCILGIIVFAYIVSSICLKRFQFKNDIIQLSSSIIKDKKIIFWWMLAIGLIVFQVLKVYYSVHPNVDDQFYVSQIKTLLDRNAIMDIMPSSGEGIFVFPDMYKLVSFETWLGVICKLFSVEAAILCHTIIPLFLIPLSYIVMYKVGKELMGDKVAIFMIFISLLNIFSGYSAFTQGAFLLLRIWQGKAVMVNIIMPLLLYVFLKIMKEKNVSFNNIVFLIALLLASFHTSTVGIIFIPISYAMYTVSYFIYSRKIKDFLKLCIPAICILPLVIQKFLLMFSTTSVDAFGEGVDKLVYEEVIYSFLSESHMLLLLCLSFIVLIIIRKKVVTYMVVLYSVLIFIFVVNPLIAHIIATKITGVAVYWRVLWLFQSSILIAVALTEVTTILKKILPQIIVFISCCWIVVFCGYTMFNDRYFPPGLRVEDETIEEEKVVYEFENPKEIIYEEDYDPMYKLSYFTIQISDIIMDIKEKENLEKVNLLLTEKKSLEIRQYADINLLYFFYGNEYYKSLGDEEFLEKLTELYTGLYIYKKWENDYLEEQLEYFDLDFVVMLVSAVEKQDVPDNLEKLYQDETYILYRIK